MKSSSLIWCGLAALFAGSIGCGRDRNCSVAQDQQSSFMASPSEFPVTLTVDTSWDESERASIQKAAEAWNAAARKAGKPSLFRIEVGPTMELVGRNAIQGCDLTRASGTRFPLVKVSGAGVWDAMGFNDSTPAVTLRCHQGEEVSKQAILVNSDLITGEQLASVFLHEMGHSLGLDHSCQLDADAPSFRGCSGLASDHPYVQAVMYPALRIMAPLGGSGAAKYWGGRVAGAPQSTPVFSYDPATLELKELLQQNDVERLACLMPE